MNVKSLVILNFVFRAREVMPTLLSSRLNTFRGASLGVGLMLCTPKQHAMSTTACHKKHMTEQLTITAKYCKDFCSADKIGSASRRERVSQYVSVSGVDEP